MELSRARGGGLVLSPADTVLALSWHAARVPLDEVSAQVRTLARRRPRSRSSLQQPVSLQLLAPRFESRTRRSQPPAPEPKTFGDALRAAARDPKLPGRSSWQSLADCAEDLLAEDAGEGYWTALVRALKAALRELPRSQALKAGAALRERIAPRPKGMPRRRYQRSLQLMLLSASSERLGVPPPAFLL